MRLQRSAADFSHPGAGRPTPHPGHAVDLPPGAAGAERPDGSGPAVRTAARPAQLRGLSGAVSLHRSDEVLELSHGQRVEGELPLV